ncbi:MAG: FecR domain-containing protein [Candidatus Omnitrophica bacterium]|nr:FecR domain-containing protein [Candidatus Omnitrophota bacterium]
MPKTPIFILLFLCLMVALSPRSRADEAFLCEVAGVQGDARAVLADGRSVPVESGMLLAANDAVHTEADQFVDLAYDGDWKNLTRIGPSTEVQIRSIHPTDLFLREGEIYALLEELPTDSTFEITTPTAIAAVRGSRFRTTHHGGRTDVFNFDSSIVFFFGLNPDGTLGSSARLQQWQSSWISSLGSAPSSPGPMDASVRQQGLNLYQALQNLMRYGSRLPGITQIQQRYRQYLRERLRRRHGSASDVDFELSTGLGSIDRQINRMKKVIRDNADRGQDITDDTSSGNPGNNPPTNNDR